MVSSTLPSTSTNTFPHSPLPPNHRALILTDSNTPPTVQTVATPQATAGSAVLRILAAGVISYMSEIYINNPRNYPYPTPLIPGTSAIGRVAAVGPDAALLKPGMLVLFDSTIRGRDDGTAIFLSAIHEGFGEGSRRLMAGEWRDGTYAEYAKVPLENCSVLDEGKLCGTAKGGLGYEVERLQIVSRLLVPFGGLRDVGLRAGETVIVAPATGSFGGAAVLVALGMGAGKLIAMGRNKAVLERVKTVNPERVEIVPITGDVMADVENLKEFGPADVFFDISPPAAAGTTHIKSGILALRHSGRVSFMGGFRDDVPIPHGFVMHKNILLRGTWMYQREDIPAMIKLIEHGVLKLDEKTVQVRGKFKLEDWEEAFACAAKYAGMGDVTVITP